MGSGIEHPQRDAVVAFFTGSPADFVPDASLMTPGGKTPNQRALAAAIALAWARLGQGRTPPMTKKDATAQTRSIFQAMANNGHQALGPTTGCEEGAPDPHSALWLAALATILREARLQQIDDLLDAALGYFADHIAMGRAFWTPAGVRMPCSRAKAKGNQPLRPNWSVDSMVFARVSGLPTQGLDKLNADSRQVLAILEDSSALFPKIVERSRTTALKLAVPIRRWPRAEGGFLAAMVKDVEMNDRCSWLIVDAEGTILNADNSLSSFTVPAGDPVVVGGGAADVGSPGGDAGGTEPQKPAPADQGLSALAATVRSLLLPHKQATLKESAARAIEEGRIADALPLLAQFGIGDQQAQAGTLKSVIAELHNREHEVPGVA